MAKFSKNTRKIEVDIPDKPHRISLRAVNKKAHKIATEYVYYIKEYKYDSETKRSQPVYVCIGIKIPSSNKMIPNDNYFELFVKKTDETSSDDSANPPSNDDSSSVNEDDKKKELTIKRDGCVLSYGNYVLINKIASELNLLEPLGASLGYGYVDTFIDLANYFILTGDSVMKNINNFTRRNFVASDRKLVDSYISAFFSQITHAEIQAFFQEWKKVVKENEAIAVDVTSISSYSKRHDFVKGHNRNEDGLPQINSFLLYGLTSKLPLYYEEYNGSVNDKTEFSNLLEHLIVLGYAKKNITFVMDRGFPTKKNFENIEKIDGLRYLSCVEVRQIHIKDNIEKLGSKFFSPANQIVDSDGDILYAKTSEVKGHPHRKFFLFSSSYRRDRAIMKLNKQISTITDKLTKGEELSKKEKKMQQRFVFATTDDQKTTFTRNEEALSKHSETLGLFAFVSNVADLSIKGCLELYKARQEVEIEFDEGKNDLSQNRKRTHNVDTNRGKTFSQFIASIIRCCIRQKIKEHNAKYKNQNKKYQNEYSSLSGVSPKDLISDLSLVEITDIFGQKEIRQTIPKLEKTELSLFNLTPADVEESAKNAVLP
jgi:hypothetical protein